MSFVAERNLQKLITFSHLFPRSKFPNPVSSVSTLFVRELNLLLEISDSAKITALSMSSVSLDRGLVRHSYHIGISLSPISIGIMVYYLLKYFHSFSCVISIPSTLHSVLTFL